MPQTLNNQTNIVVTGSNGFVGRRLVAGLLTRQCNVIGMDIQNRSTGMLPDIGFRSIACDLQAISSAGESVIADADFVIHLAAQTRSARQSDLLAINTAITQSVVNACLGAKDPPVLIFASSLAACGATVSKQPLTESDPCRPRSFYGKSKLACEALLHDHAGRLPISVVRAPIVLGPGDPTGLRLFRSIDNWGMHLVPGRHDANFSVVHVDELVNAMIAVANNGKRHSNGVYGRGTYFVSADETFTYAELGRAIGKVLGRERVRVIHIHELLIKVLGLLNDGISRVTGKARYLNSGKLGDAMAGDWVCSNEKLKSETGFKTLCSFQDRLVETATWYRAEGWL